MFYSDYIQLNQDNKPQNIKNIILTAKDIRYCYEHEKFNAPFNFEISLTDCISLDNPLPGIRSLTVPNGVTIIGTGCFEKIRNATIYIPATVSFIARDAFDYFSDKKDYIDTNYNTIIIDPNNPYYKVENGNIVRKQ